MKKLNRAFIIITGILALAGCGGDKEEETMTKEEAAKQAKADETRDFCAEFGWYGDGICDTFCLQPDPDCGGEQCIEEGQGFEDFNTEGKCCEGLIAVPDEYPDDIGQCVGSRCPCFVCTSCGNGTCGPGENECNCPDDCESLTGDCDDGSQLSQFCDMVPVCDEGLIPAIQNRCFACVDPFTCQEPGPDCDDGSQLSPYCDMVPVCDEGLIPAIQNSCFSCVDPETCEEPASDCDDGTQLSQFCDMVPACDEGLIPAIQNSCFVCVDPETCEEPAQDCDDGTQLSIYCDMVPTCDEGLIPAIQNACWECVDPETCEAP